ncbi:MAG: hypothetical protein R2762_17395 [Bryobacteraceae bacterium]
MQYRCCYWMVMVAVVAPACANDASPMVLERFRTQIRETLKQLPDYTCLQSIERSRRPSESVAYKAIDSIRVQVGLIGGSERYSWPDSRRFEDTELRNLVGKGVVSTGNFALHVQHVFLSPATQYSARGEAPANGRKGLRYDYELPVEHSRYMLRFPPNEEEVGVRGSFLLDAETLDLMHLEVIADEISPEMGVMAVTHSIDYARTPIGNGQFLLPGKARLTVIDLTGEEHRNDSVFSECRQYKAESKLSFETEGEAKPEADPGAAAISSLPVRLTVEAALAHDIDPSAAALGDGITAVVSKPVVHEGKTLAGAGATLQGRLVRLDKETIPFPHYVVGLEFHTLKSGDASYDFSATMQQAGPSAGLIRQTKRMDPVFTKRRQKRFDILVREKPRGEGVLHWDAKKPKVPKGLRTVWVTIDSPDSQ